MDDWSVGRIDFAASIDLPLNLNLVLNLDLDLVLHLVLSFFCTFSTLSKSSLIDMTT
jgi:hypothetical protein